MSNEVEAMSGAPIKILLVEDHPTDARMAAELLSELLGGATRASS